MYPGQTLTIPNPKAARGTPLNKPIEVTIQHIQKAPFRMRVAHGSRRLDLDTLAPGTVLHMTFAEVVDNQYDRPVKR